MKKFTLIVVVLAMALVASACDSGESASPALQAETAQADRISERFNQTQPVPEFEWSQLRQNLIELLTAQARTTQTTTFFFNLGIQEPLSWCPSIGFPIPATYQLTNPERGIKVETVAGGGDPAVDVAQLESTGVYTADTTGTYVMCVNTSGQAYAFYWEGFVSSVTGAAEWQDGQIVLIGEPTFDFSEGR